VYRPRNSGRVILWQNRADDDDDEDDDDDDDDDDVELHVLGCRLAH